MKLDLTQLKFKIEKALGEVVKGYIITSMFKN